MWSLNPLALTVLAGIVVAASVASGATGYRIGRSSGDRDVRAMMEAGQKALVKRDQQIATNLELYREDIAAVSARRPKRVFFCPPGSVPPAPGRAAGAGAAEPDRRADETDLRDHDYGPELRAARDALLKCNVLIRIVQ